jgi:XTP/dITP diphosphohydrolase
MTFPDTIAIATHNAHKLKELARICADWPVTWARVGDLDASAFPEVEETGDTYLENALLKARAVTSASGLPAVADDSGIEVDALGGKPGPRSARFAGENATDEENLAALMRALRGIPRTGRSARYRCVAAIAYPDGRTLSAEGVCEGTLEPKRRGEGGFGYDPIFVPEGWDETMAEITPEQKDRISHRGRAFRALRALLQTDDAPAPAAPSGEPVPDSR